MKRILCAALACGAVLLFSHCNSGDSGDVSIEPDQTVEVLIDVAHGGLDPGAISAIDGTTEKDALMAFGDALRIDLRQNGIVSVLDRPDDRFVSLNDRAKLANGLKPALVVSLHLNVSRDSSNQGFVVYYQRTSDRSRSLGSEIQAQLRTLHYLKDNGLRTASFGLLKSINAPAVLVDLAYLSNREDLSALKEPTRRAQIVQKLTYAIMRYRGS